MTLGTCTENFQDHSLSTAMCFSIQSKNLINVMKDLQRRKQSNYACFRKNIVQVCIFEIRF